MSAQALTDELHAMAGHASDVSDAFEQAAHQFRAAADEWFFYGGDGTWPAWSDHYATYGPASSLLVKSGNLLASFTGAHRNHIFKIDGNELTIGSRHPTANLHRTPRGATPARDPMPDPSLYEQKWMDTMDEHLGFGASGGLGL